MAEDTGRSIHRQIAKKVGIGTIASSRYVRSEGEWEPNYIESPAGEQFSRINLIAAVIDKSTVDEPGSLTLDDSTGSITVRAFQNPQILKNVSIGDIVLLVGRPREFSNEIFLVPEIIKRIDNKRWVELRKLELAVLELREPKQPKKSTPQPRPAKQQSPQQLRTEETARVEKKVEEVVVEDIGKESSALTESDRIFNLIESLDNDAGVDIEEVIERSKIKNAEKIINSFLESGTIFEIRPGRVKILN